MRSIEENWTNLSDGIAVERLGVSIPWLVTKDELFRLIPESEFHISEGGCWPMLRFKLLGFSAVWGFNFVSRGGGRLVELQFRNCNYHTPKRSYRRSHSHLQRALGKPGMVDGTWQQTWRVGRIWIDNYVSPGTNFRTLGKVPVHTLSIWCKGGA